MQREIYDREVDNATANAHTTAGELSRVFAAIDVDGRYIPRPVFVHSLSTKLTISLFVLQLFNSGAIEKSEIMRAVRNSTAILEIIAHSEVLTKVMGKPRDWVCPQT